jgi:uncharacterized protein
MKSKKDYQFPEMSEAFGISLQQWIYFGGYPGAVSFIENEELWKSYIRDSYNKMLGQLVDAGNTTTLAHYVRILETAFLLSGLELFKIGKRPKRGSSPKLVLWNNALISAVSAKPLSETLDNPELWGRLVENTVGSSLLNELRGLPYELFYWRHGNDEVDYILHTPPKTWAIEVKADPPLLQRPSATQAGRPHPPTVPDTEKTPLFLLLRNEHPPSDRNPGSRTPGPLSVSDRESRTP